MHNVYILKEINGNRTYVGYTVNLERRIRQHNGEIKGGAKYTRGKKWEYFAYISNFPDKIIALQCEWKLKHSNKIPSIKGRIEGIKSILSMEKYNSIPNLELHLFQNIDLPELPIKKLNKFNDEIYEKNVGTSIDEECVMDN